MLFNVADNPTLRISLEFTVFENIFPFTPTPPEIVSAPVVFEVELVVSVIETVPLDVKPVNVPSEVMLGWLLAFAANFAL